MVTKEHIDVWFKYHPPQNASQQEKYERLRDGAKAFAQIILETTPVSADQTAAIRKVREAVMTANAAIACDGLLPAHPLEKKVSNDPPMELRVAFEQMMDQITIRAFWKDEFIVADRMTRSDMIVHGDPRNIVHNFILLTQKELISRGHPVTEDHIWAAITQAAADMEKRVRRNPLKIGG
jgi:hypothetical protein